MDHTIGAVYRQVTIDTDAGSIFSDAGDGAAGYLQAANVNAVTALTGDDAASHLQAVADMDAFFAARRSQAAGAGDDQIPVHGNAVVNRIASNSGLALQLNGQLALGIDAIAVTPCLMCRRDVGVTQRQGIGVGVVHRGAVAASDCIVIGGQNILVIHIQGLHLYLHRIGDNNAACHTELCHTRRQLVLHPVHPNRGIIDRPASNRRCCDRGCSIGLDAAIVDSEAVAIGTLGRDGTSGHIQGPAGIDADISGAGDLSAVHRQAGLNLDANTACAVAGAGDLSAVHRQFSPGNDTSVFCAGAGDLAVDYLHIPKNIDAGCAAHGVQAAGAGNGQIPVHVNAV